MEFNTSKSLSSTNCAITGTAIKCTNTLINDDVEFIKNNASTVTSLDLTAKQNMITQKQLDNITSTAFPLLDTLSISYNEITNLNLAKFPALTKLTAMGVKNITGFNDIKNNLTTVEISKESRIDLADIIGIADKTKVTTLGLGDYIETNLNISGFTNLMNLSVSDMENLTTLDLSKLTNLTKLDIWYIDNLATLDLSKLTNLTNLDIWNMENLVTLDLSKLTNLTNLQVSHIDNIVTLTLPTDVKNLTNLQVWSLPQLNNLDISEFTNLTSLEVGNLPKLTALTLSELTNLTSLEVESLNQLTTLTLPTDATNLTNLVVYNLTGLTGLDLSALTNLTKLSVISVKNITGFNDIKNNLTTIEVSKESGINLTDIIGITGVTDKTKVTILRLQEYTDTELNISGFTNLTELTVWVLPITELDLSALTANLTSLSLGSNTSLATLNLGTTSFVKGLKVTGNGNTALDEIEKITFLKDDKITINLTDPNIVYPPAP